MRCKNCYVMDPDCPAHSAKDTRCPFYRLADKVVSMRAYDRRMVEKYIHRQWEIKNPGDLEILHNIYKQDFAAIHWQVKTAESSRRTVAKRAADPALVAERERRGMVVKPDPKGKGKASGSNTFPSQAAYAPNAPFQKIVSRILGKEGERETTPMVRANPTHHIIPNNSYTLCYSPHNPLQMTARMTTSSSANRHTHTRTNSFMYLFFYRTCTLPSCKDGKSVTYVTREPLINLFPYGWTKNV